jgi:hypothetical protein
MNHSINYLFSTAFTCGIVCAGQGLYYTGDVEKESLPIKWTLGSNIIYDDNLVPTVPSGSGFEESAVSINPYAQLSLTNVSPQTTIDLYARLGVIYFFTDSETPGADDTFPSARVGFDINHNFNSRVRFSSRNSLAYEFEPDYSRGFSTPRGVDPYTLWSSDNSIGYRFTERVGTYTGLVVGGLESDVDIARRFTWEVYEQLRYQYSKRSVLTAGYRYSQWSGDQQDSTNHFVTGGIEHRLSSTSIVVASAGAQFRDVDGTDDDGGASPFFEMALNSQLNSRVSVRAFTRYSVEDFDTVQVVGADPLQFADQQVLRIGVSSSYELTPRLTAIGGIDFVSTDFNDGTNLNNPTDKDSGKSEEVINVSLGLRATINPALSGECILNYTDSTSDFSSATFTRDFDRMRLSVGVNYTF